MLRQKAHSIKKGCEALSYLELVEQRKALGVARLLETFNQLPDLRRQVKKGLKLAVGEMHRFKSYRQKGCGKETQSGGGENRE